MKHKFKKMNGSEKTVLFNYRFGDSLASKICIKKMQQCIWLSLIRIWFDHSDNGMKWYLKIQ